MLLFLAASRSQFAPPNLAVGYLNRKIANLKHCGMLRTLRADLFSCEVVTAQFWRSPVCLIFMAQMWYCTGFYYLEEIHSAVEIEPSVLSYRNILLKHFTRNGYHNKLL